MHGLLQATLGKHTVLHWDNSHGELAFIWRTLGSALLTMTMWTSLKARSSCPPSQRLRSFIASHSVTAFRSCVQPLLYVALRCRLCGFHA